MDFNKQTRRAAEIHAKFLVPGDKTCIDCHKGIAHELPNMDGIDPGWKMPKELEGKKMAAESPVDELQRAIADYHHVSEQ
jgi:cytochrome c-type protein NapC